MKKITQFSVNYPITVLMLVLAILLLGYISFERLGIDLFPKLNSPRLFVELQSGEKPPEEIEKNYVDNLESLSIRQKNVTHVSSISTVGGAQITVEYSWDMDMDEAFLDLQKTITSATQNWEIDELNITQYDPNAAPVMIIAFSNPEESDMSKLRKTAENYIRNELIRLEGIADVEINGAEKKEIRLETTPYILEAHGLTIDDLSNQVQKFNRNVSGGSITELGKKYVIKGVSLYQNIDDFKNTILKYERIVSADSVGFAPVYIKDVAKVEFINADPENIVSLDGKRCIGLSVYKETKFNTVQAVEDLKDELEILRKALPGYQFVVIQDQGKFISSSISEVEETAAIGIILAVIILFVFLRRLGITMIISVAIPISIVATFNLMYFNGLTLNIMTLGGLALGAGMLVDNAIVVMENIFRNIENGMSVREAAVVGTAEVGGAITASTITTIIVFLPIVYLHGASGELFKDQAWTVAFSLVSSLFVALLVIPMLSARFLKSVNVKSANRSVQFKRYPNFLGRVLNLRWLIILFSVILVAGTFAIIPFIGSEFMPKTSGGEITLDVKLAQGTELDRTSSTVVSIEELLRSALGDKASLIYTHSGPSTNIESTVESFFEDENNAVIKILLTEKGKKSPAWVENTIMGVMSGIPELEYSFSESGNPLNAIMGTEDAPVVVEVKGEDLDVLEQLTAEVKKEMVSLAELANVESTFENGAPEVDVEIDRLKTGLYNISTDQIATQLKDKLEGKNAGNWDYEGELNDITIRIPDVMLSELGDITIKSGGMDFRLSELADIKISNAPKEILRHDQNRIGKVTAQIAADIPYDHLVEIMRQRFKSIELPQDYSIVISGEELKRRESMSNLTFALLLSIILVYMALASQFESLVHPFTILLTIPLAGVGAVLMFALLGIPFNIMAFIGIIMLAGIAVNDSIILVDAINQLQNGGMERIEAIKQAGARRIRPIIMTSLTTILALLPLTFGYGEGAELRSPMALAVIGGLITSTLLTLIVIPCVYYVLDVFREKLKIKV